MSKNLTHLINNSNKELLINQNFYQLERLNFPLCEKDHAHTFSKLIDEKHHESSLILGKRELDRAKVSIFSKISKDSIYIGLNFPFSKSHYCFHRWNLEKHMISKLKTLSYAFRYLHSFFIDFNQFFVFL